LGIWHDKQLLDSMVQMPKVRVRKPTNYVDDKDEKAENKKADDEKAAKRTETAEKPKGDEKWKRTA